MLATCSIYSTCWGMAGHGFKIGSCMQRRSQGAVTRESECALLQGLPSGVAVPAHVAETLTLAHLLDQMWAQRPSKQMEASPWYEHASHLVRSELTCLTSGDPKVCAPSYRAVSRTLPDIFATFSYIHVVVNCALVCGSRWYGFSFPLHRNVAKMGKNNTMFSAAQALTFGLLKEVLTFSDEANIALANDNHLGTRCCEQAFMSPDWHMLEASHQATNLQLAYQISRHAGF